jgi:hypothetical protein
MVSRFTVVAAAVAGLRNVCQIMSEAEGGAQVALLASAFALPLQPCPGRVLLREGGFELQLAVTYPGPGQSDVQAALGAPRRAPGRVWLFNDCCLVALSVTPSSGGGPPRFEARAILPLLLGPAAGLVQVSRTQAVSNSSSSNSSSLVVTLPPITPAVAASTLGLPPLCGALPVAALVASPAPGMAYTLTLWPVAPPSASASASASTPSPSQSLSPSTLSPSAAASVEAKLTQWQEDFALVASGGASDPLLPRYRSSAARERTMEEFRQAAEAEAAEAAARAKEASTGLRTPTPGMTTSTHDKCNVAKLSSGTASSVAEGPSESEQAVLRAIADVATFPVSTSTRLRF